MRRIAAPDVALRVPDRQVWGWGAVVGAGRLAKTLVTLVVASSLGVAGPLAAAAAAPTVQVAQNAKLGAILVTGSGLTLYTFGKDKPGVSNCTGACAKIWPPLEVTATPTAGAGVPGTLGVLTRASGHRQVTYNGRPLYRYAADAKPGQTNGQGLFGLWYAARPGAAAVALAKTGAASALPKTGASPLGLIGGLALLGAGLALTGVGRRRRRRAA